MKASKVVIGDAQIAFEVQGDSGPWVTFSHSLGCTRHMWRRQIDALADRCRVLSYDLPGHGASTVSAESGSLRRLASDVRALWDHLAIERSHFVGISIGGMIGQTLAIESPSRVDSLVLANTTAFMPPPAVSMWAQRIAQAQANGLSGIALASLERWFPADFRLQNTGLIVEMAQVFSRTSIEGFVACSQAIMGLDTRQNLGAIRCPVLIIGGTEDPGAPAEALRQLNQGARGSELVLLQGAGHLSSIDAADAFTKSLTRFIVPSGFADQGMSSVQKMNSRIDAGRSQD